MDDPLRELLASYRPAPHRRDEMLSADGSVRAPWDYLAHALARLGPAGLQQRREDTERILRNQGVSYGISGDTQGRDRPWRMDPVPVIIDSREWRDVEAGLVQRADLMNRLLADIHGPAKLLQQGLLPAEVVFADPEYLRPCAGVNPPGGQWLHLYAADLARDGQGTLRVIGDHTATPEGMGYALESRIVLSRVIPSVFRDAHPHRLRRFFQNLRECLARLAPGDADSYTTALLSAGPGSPTWFEDAYLAHFLGYQLAEGRDLRVQDGQLWLRTLSGLQPVHVLLRRLADRLCDPLELDRQAMKGTSGLLQMARTGSVAIVNPMGASVAQSPLLRPFLPALCQHLLGEELRLPGQQAWWCGEAAHLEHVLQHLPELMIHALDRGRHETLTGASLDSAQREALAARMAAKPALFTAETPVERSCAPVVSGEALSPRPLEIRTFVVAEEHGWYVMPGGLGRAGASADSHDVSLASGGVSKDVWVIASEPAREEGVATLPGRPWPFPHQEGAISRRIADNLFWMGRYLERADAQTRILRENVLAHLELGDGAGNMQQQLLQLAGATQEGIAPAEAIRERMDSAIAGGLAFNLWAVQRTARAAQDRLNRDAWRLINSLGNRPAQPGDGLLTLQSRLEDLVTRIAAVRALSFDGMQTDRGRRLLSLGLRLERALQLIMLVRHAPLAGSTQEFDMAETLFAVAGVNPNQYRRPDVLLDGRRGVLRLLLHEPGNPRSVASLLVRLDQDLGELHTHDQPSMQTPVAQQPVLAARRLLEGIVPESLDQPAALGRLATELEQQLEIAADQLAEEFLRDTQQTRQLVNLQATGVSQS